MDDYGKQRSEALDRATINAIREKVGSLSNGDLLAFLNARDFVAAIGGLDPTADLMAAMGLLGFVWRRRGWCITIGYGLGNIAVVFDLGGYSWHSPMTDVAMSAEGSDSFAVLPVAICRAVVAAQMVRDAIFEKVKS